METEDWLARADAALRVGEPLQAIEALRHAVAVYAADAFPGASRLRAYGAAARHLADLLMSEDHLAEAMQAYQEAANAYGQVPGAEAEAQACARQIVAGIKLLRSRPEERLYLLIAHIEREQRQWAELPGAALRQAECALRIAQVFHRATRYTEAEPYYLDALDLFAQAEMPEEAGMGQAVCHHRLADLYHYVLPDLRKARTHYGEAIRHYALYEPLQDDSQPQRVRCEKRLDSLLLAIPEDETHVL